MLLKLQKINKSPAGTRIFFFLKYFSKLAAQALDVLADVRLDFFMLRTSEAQKIAKKRYMKCTFCLSLVGALYPSELELPAISGWSR